MIDLPINHTSRVWRRRISQGMDQRTVAERAGISVSYLYRIENKKATPSPAVITALAAALDCTEDYLLERTYDPRGHAE